MKKSTVAGMPDSTTRKADGHKVVRQSFSELFKWYLRAKGFDG